MFVRLFQCVSDVMNRRLMLMACVAVALASLADAFSCDCIKYPDSEPSELCNHPSNLPFVQNGTCDCDCGGEPYPVYPDCDVEYCTQSPSSNPEDRRKIAERNSATAI